MDKAQLARDTYREPEVEKCCGDCKHWRFDEMCNWCGLVGFGQGHDNGDNKFGWCDTWESRDG